MAPLPITEDYYKILEVDQTAQTQEIVSAYRRLALKVHPDRNIHGVGDATEAFQRLVRAYDTLKDATTRASYDLIYPSLKHNEGIKKQEHNEATQCAALYKSKRDRSAQWQTKKSIFGSSICEIQRSIQKLEQEIRNLNSIRAAEAAEEAARNSWTMWLISPLYKQREDSEEEKAQKDRGRQERQIEKDMKERRLEIKKADLRKEEDAMRKAKEAVDAADLEDDRKLQGIHMRVWARENAQRQEKERAERERKAQILRQQQRQMQEEREKRQREAEEALRKQQAKEREKRQREAEEALRKQQAEEQRRRDALRMFEDLYTFADPYKESDHQAWTSSCIHDGWWPKVQMRAACPRCHEVWTYLLQCPGCSMKACPRCQADIRPRRRRGRAPLRVRTPSPDDYFSYY